MLIIDNDDYFRHRRNLSRGSDIESLLSRLTSLISGIAMVVAVPIGLMSAIYLSEYANKTFRAAAKPLIEILAGIPTVVYGFFAALTVAPFIRDTGSILGQK